MANIRRASRTRRTAAGIALATAVTGLGSAALATAPAQSETTTECPAAYPVADLVRDQEVNGKTVSEGTTPDPFSGHVIGVLRDGIAPGLDMVMVELTSPAIDANGIWAGMSGSPVYIDDQNGNKLLVGAVSYGLAYGNSPVAGVTPYAEMRKLLTGKQADAAAGKRVDVPAPLARRIARTTDATLAQARGGFRRLPLQWSASGFLTQRRLDKAARRFDFGNSQVRASGTAAPARAGNSRNIVAGGNLAATISYGDLTYGGIGTATAVCGRQVLAFGHPAMFSGPSQMTMHGADALYVQKDLLASFKVANITGAVGGIRQDRLAGLQGMLGAAPDTTVIRSTVSAGRHQRIGRTWISVPDAVPDISASHLLVDQDRVFDGIGAGSGRVGWTVHGLRADGTPFRFSRTDRFADSYDITFLPAYTLYSQLAQIQGNRFEDVRITRITTDSTLVRTVRQWHLEKVRWRSAGEWRSVNRRHPVRTHPGSTVRLRVTLGSFRDRMGERVVRLQVSVPKRAGRANGYLSVRGGNDPYGFFFYGSGGQGSAGSFDGVLQRLRRAPHNDSVLAELNLFGRRSGEMQRADRTRANAVVNGNRTIRVVVRPTRR